MNPRRLLLLTPLALGLFSCAPAQQEDPSFDGKIWSGYSYENFQADLTYDLDRPASLSFSGMKGEKEGAQLLLTPNRFVLHYDLTIGDAKNGEDVLPSSCFTPYAEYYVNVTNSIEENSYFGYYPDALIPFEGLKFRKLDYLQAGRNQGIYVLCDIPKDAKPGTYEGKATLTLDDESYDVPYSVKVYGISLPEVTHEQTICHMWYNQLSEFEGAKKGSDPEFQLKYFDFAVDHHFMPELPPEAFIDPAGNYEKYVQFLLDKIVDNPKVSTFCLPDALKTSSLIGGVELDDSMMDKLFGAMVNKELELKGEKDLFAKAMCYFSNLIDEPEVQEYPLVQDTDLKMTKLKKKWAEKLSAYPELQKSLLNLRILITTPYAEGLQGSDEVGGVQTWCPGFHHFQTEEDRALYASIEKGEKTTREYGEHVWWYGCIYPASPLPSYHTDAPLITARGIPWMERKYGIEGNLYWGLSFFRDNTNGGPRDVWNDPDVGGGANGDGQLVYPGRQFLVDGPISTMRLETIRDGEEDYECLYLFEEYIQKYNEENGASLDSASLLSSTYDSLFSGIVMNQDPEGFQATREKLLSTLEGMNIDLKKTVESLL